MKEQTVNGISIRDAQIGAGILTRAIDDAPMGQRQALHAVRTALWHLADMGAPIVLVEPDV